MYSYISYKFIFPYNRGIQIMNYTTDGESLRRINCGRWWQKKKTEEGYWRKKLVIHLKTQEPFIKWEYKRDQIRI